MIDSSTRYLRSLSLFEARERSASTTFLPDDMARSDCWPDWSTDAAADAEIAKRAEENSPGRVLFEAGLVLGTALALAALAMLLTPAL
ncbi:MAG: hypothetical protein WDN03_06265 [Rhizomicrobium sp.]